MDVTRGAINQLVRMPDKQRDPGSVKPVLQVLKIIPVGSQQQRYRVSAYYKQSFVFQFTGKSLFTISLFSSLCTQVILSDGVNHAQGMLATTHNDRCINGDLIENSLIRINECISNWIQEKNVIIVINFDIVNTHYGQKIGTPVDLGLKKSDILASAPPQPNNMGHIRPSGNYNSNPSVSTQNAYGNVRGGGGSNPYNSAPIVHSNNSHDARYTPIAGLNMYQNRWTIKARVTKKDDIRTWQNAKGEGQLFSAELLDSSMDIRCTFFREAVDKFYPLLEEDKVYTFSGGRLKAANMQYNTCKSSFECTFDQNAEIHLVEDTGEIIQQNYEFVNISQLESIEAGKFVDIIGVIKNASEAMTLTSKRTGKELLKAELVVGDDSGAEVTCTVWGEKAKTVAQEMSANPVVSFRRAKVGDYGGRTLSSNQYQIQPRVPETQRILNWWNAGGSSSTARSLSSTGGGGGRFPTFEERKPISAIKTEQLGYTSAEKPDYISFKGTFSFLKSDKEGGAWYTACPRAEEPCKNRFKVNQQSDGQYYCEKCNGTFSNCMRKFIFSGTFSDDSSTTWVSLFNEQAETLFKGMTADQMWETMESGNNGQDDYDNLFKRSNFTDWILNCKVKQEMMNDEMRIKTSITSLHPVDYAKEGRSLFNSLISMQQ
jgi:replication factor A1